MSALSDGAAPPAELLLPSAALALSLASSTACGLTGFGDAITYHILWALAATSALVPQAGLRTAVSMIAVAGFTMLPLLLFFARADLRRMLPYSLAISASQIPMSALGTYMLYHASVASIQVFVGIFFLLFAATRLTAAALEAARGRRSASEDAAAVKALQAPAPVATVAAVAPMAPDREQPAAAVAPAVLVSAAVPAALPMALSQPLSAMPPPLPPPLTPLSSWVDRVAPISTAGFSVRISLLVVAAAGLLSGFLNGLLGTGGPPLMIAFGLLVVDKDDVRAISAITILLELPVRIAILSLANDAFSVSSGPSYAATAAGAAMGFLFGTYLRRFVDSLTMLRVLLVFVLLSSGVLLGALSSAAIATAFCASVAAWLLLVGAAAIWVARPDFVLTPGAGVARARQFVALA